MALLLQHVWRTRHTQAYKEGTQVSTWTPNNGGYSSGGRTSLALPLPHQQLAQRRRSKRQPLAGTVDGGSVDAPLGDAQRVDVVAIRDFVQAEHAGREADHQQVVAPVESRGAHLGVVLLEEVLGLQLPLAVEHRHAAARTVSIGSRVGDRMADARLQRGRGSCARHVGVLVVGEQLRGQLAALGPLPHEHGGVLADGVDFVILGEVYAHDGAPVPDECDRYEALHGV